MFEDLNFFENETIFGIPTFEFRFWTVVSNYKCSLAQNVTGQPIYNLLLLYGRGITEEQSTKNQGPATFWLGVLAKSPTIEVNGKYVTGVQPLAACLPNNLKVVSSNPNPAEFCKIVFFSFLMHDQTCNILCLIALNLV